MIDLFYHGIEILFKRKIRPTHNQKALIKVSISTKKKIKPSIHRTLDILRSLDKMIGIRVLNSKETILDFFSLTILSNSSIQKKDVFSMVPLN